MYSIKSSIQFFESPASRLEPVGRTVQKRVEPGDQVILLDPEVEGELPWSIEGDNWRWSVEKFQEVTKDFLIEKTDAEAWAEVEGKLTFTGSHGQVLLHLGKDRKMENP